MTKQKILICGGTGFIGRNCAEYFQHNKKFEIFATYHRRTPPEIPGITFLKVNLTNPKEVERALAGKDVIIQAAASTSGAHVIVNHPELHVTDNAIMNSLIFRAALRHKPKNLVFFSCSVLYHSSKKSLKETDFNPNQALYPAYFGVGWTKIYLEKMCEFYSRIGKTNYTVIRHSNIYGPHDKFDPGESHVCAALIAKAAQASRTITLWGKGQEKRDLLYIDDLVRFIALVIQKQREKFSLYNVGSGFCISIEDLAKTIISLSAKPLQVRYDTQKISLDTCVCLNIEKARRQLGWKPKIALTEGLAKTIAWYNKSRSYKENR